MRRAAAVALTRSVPPREVMSVGNNWEGSATVVDVVSRPSFADVVGIDLTTGVIVWWFPMAGYREPPDGPFHPTAPAWVSDSTANKGARSRPAHRCEAARVRRRRLPA